MEAKAKRQKNHADSSELDQKDHTLSLHFFQEQSVVMILFSLPTSWCLFSANIKSSLAGTEIQGGVCRGVLEGRGCVGDYI